MSIELPCPGCRKRLAAPEQLAGKRAVCPDCGSRFRIPAAGEAAGSSPRPRSPAVPAGRPSGSQSPSQRMSQPAKFIASRSAAPRVELGADGRLPELVLHEGGRKQPQREGQPRGRSPMLLGVVGCSLAISAMALLLDGQVPQRQRESKSEARRQIEVYYSSPGPSLQPYQQLLREALQAHHRGDRATERRLCRQVLDMLRAEDRNPTSGLTGLPDAHAPPSDRHLEQLLSTLLSKE